MRGQVGADGQWSSPRICSDDEVSAGSAEVWEWLRSGNLRIRELEKLMCSNRRKGGDEE